MKAEITIHVDGTRAVGGLEGMAARTENIGPPLVRWCDMLVRKARRILSSGERGIKARHASRGLAGTLNHRVEAPEFRIGSPLPYARVQNVGGTIESSRPGGFLAMPTMDNLAGQGFDPIYQLPEDVPGGFVLAPKSGRLVGLLFIVSEFVKGAASRLSDRKVGKVSKRGKFSGAKAMMKFWFQLLRRVKIPAHEYLTIDDADRADWTERLRRWLLEGKV